VKYGQDAARHQRELVLHSSGTAADLLTLFLDALTAQDAGEVRLPQREQDVQCDTASTERGPHAGHRA
jgi:hypothetical protein